jgi:hypothetical protein
VKRHPRRRAFSLLMLVLAGTLLLSGCTSVVLPESWAGLTIDAELADGRYTDARYLYVTYRNTVFRVDTQKSPEGRPNERLVDWAAAFPNNGQGFAAPTLGQIGDKPVVYAASYSNTLYAFSPAAVNRVAPLPEFAASPTATRLIASPLLHENVLYQGLGDHGVNAYEASTGRLLGSSGKTEKAIWAKPLLDLDSQTLYVAAIDHYIYAYDLATLKEKWKIALDGSIVATPLLVDGRLYVGTFARQLVSIDVRGNQPRIETVYTTEGWVWAAPTLYNGLLYFGDMAGFVYALDLNLTAKWKVANPAELGGVRGQVAVVDDKVIAPFEKNFLQAFNTENGALLWKSSPPAGDRILGDVKVIDQWALVTTQREDEIVVAYNINDGVRVWWVRKPNNDDLTRLAQTIPQ